MSLEQQRREYSHDRLTRESLQDSPFDQFSRWLEDALASAITDPTAMVLATVDGGGRPWQRIVLLKHCDHNGFVFYTNLGSRKARDIAGNPRVSLHFPWNHLDRQVIVGGSARRISAAEAIRYFVARGQPAGSLGLSPELAPLFPPSAGGPVPADAGKVSPRRDSHPGFLGRLPGGTRRVRILAGGGEASPRPVSVPVAG